MLNKYHWLKYSQFGGNSFVYADFQPGRYRPGLASRIGLHTLRRRIRKTIHNMPVDDQCGDVFDPAVDTAIEQAKNKLEGRYLKSLYDIKYANGKLTGELEFAKECLRNLEQELEELNVRYEEQRVQVEKRKGCGIK